MDRNEFISILRSTLAEELPYPVVDDNVRYYDSYISQEIASGKTEREVMEALGDPRLIARTIIDTQDVRQPYNETDYYEEYDDERQQGLHAEMNENGGIDIKYNKFNFNTWYGKLLIAVVLILILVLLIRIVGGILSWILPVLIPVLVVIWLVDYFFGRR